MPIDSARAIWEVTAGLLPGQAEAEHTRRFGITSGEWEKAREAEALADGPMPLLMARFGEAVAYATFLQLLCAEGRAVNWVRIDFVWP